MKTQTKEAKKPIDQEIERVLSELKKLSVDTDEYHNAVGNLKVLYEAKGIKSHSDISTDAIIAGGVNILGILLVLYFERTGIITSKAFGMLFKGRGS